MIIPETNPRSLRARMARVERAYEHVADMEGSFGRRTNLVGRLLNGWDDRARGITHLARKVLAREARQKG